MRLHIAIVCVGISLAGVAQAQGADGAGVTTDLQKTLERAEDKLAKAKSEVEYGRKLIALWQNLQKDPSKLAAYMQFRAKAPRAYKFSDAEVRVLFSIAMQHNRAVKHLVKNKLPIVVKLSLAGEGHNELETRFMDTLQMEAKAAGLKILPHRPGTKAKGWVLSQTLATRNQGSIMSTRMKSLSVGGNYRLMDENGALEDGFDNNATVGHINESVGYLKASEKAAKQAVRRLMEHLLKSIS